MFWSIIQVALSAVLAIFAARKETKGKLLYWLLVFLILGAGVASVLKDSQDARDLAELRGELASRDQNLESLQQTSLEKISQLQSKVDNADLQRELSGVKKELEAARNPPRARLEFGFETDVIKGTLEKTVTVEPENGVVGLRLLVRNASLSLDALDIASITFILPNGFALVDEESPKRLTRTRDSPPNILTFERVGTLPVKGALTTFHVKISVPPDAKSPFPIGFRYACRNCRPGDLQRADVTIANPSQ